MASVPRSIRRASLAFTTAALAGLIAASSVLAATPVTIGYRDMSYGGGAARPSADKPQSKLWYTNGKWFGGMFLNQTNGEYRIWEHNASTHNWAVKATAVDIRDTAHADYLWDETSQTLYVASIPTIPSSVPATAVVDGMQVFKYTYSAASNTYTAAAGFPKTIQNTATVPNTTAGGAATATIALNSSGALWVVWPKDTQVRYSRSTDGGITWSDPAQVPAQAANSIRGGNNLTTNSAAVIAYGTTPAGSNVGIMWSDHDALPTNSATSDGFYFASIAAGADPTVAGNWTLEKLPSLIVGGESADNHVNVKTTSDGSVYMVGKTGKDTINCATNKQQPLIEFFERTPTGTWSVHLVGTAGDCNTRAQLVISEELDAAYVFLTAPNGGGTIFRKAAPLNGPDAFDFRGAADQTVQPGTPFIRSATETQIDDPSTTKQVVTAASDIVVIANNLTSTAKFYLHNDLAIAATDSTAPAGTITIAGGASATRTADVSVAVPATDAGSGVSLVRISNSGAVSGGVLTSGTTFAYNTPIAWTLTAGDGTKTVYAQWRDSAGNWSTPVNDTIVLDPNAPGEMPFTDVTSFRTAIQWLWDNGITGGCTPTKFCPNAPVTRAQMAMFLDRTMDLPSDPAGTDYFDDDDGKTGEASINDLAFSEITGGCGPRRYCPTASVTRAQMAIFLDRRARPALGPGRHRLLRR